jgi:hypothetical protein
MFHLRRLTLVGLVLLTALWSGLPRGYAAQPLPASPWYVVLYLPQNDLLLWVNTNGQQASLARPKLPNENAVTPDPQITIAPNGQYGVISATLNNGRQGVGIYNFQTGQFVRTHESQANEVVTLAQEGYDLSSSFVAVSLLAAAPEDPAWRVVIFDLATGNALNQLTHQGISAPLGATWLPIISYVAGVGPQATVHFQLLPKAAGPGPTAPAYAWTLTSNSTQPSPYTSLFADVHPQTGAATFTYVDPNFPLVPQDSPLPPQNAIGWQQPTSGQTVGSNPTLIYANPSQNNFGAVWANSGNWVVFGAQLPSGTQWNVVQRDLPPGVNPITLTEIIGVHGTSNGYIMQSGNYDLFFANNLAQPNGQVFFKPLIASRLLYVTPFGANFTLTSLADGSGGVVSPNPPQAAGACPNAPAQRLQVGQPARVTFTDGTPLRVRVAPGGSIITQLAEGVQMNVLGGPQCGNNFSWWQIQTNVNGSLINGWVAEGDFADYYVEPLPGGGGAVQAPTLAVAPSLTPVVIANDCSQAPVQRLSMGKVAKVVITSGTLALYTNFEDAIPSNQIPPGAFLNVIEGPRCKQARFWRVQFSLNGQQLSGWVSEGTQSQYFLEPVN